MSEDLGNTRYTLIPTEETYNDRPVYRVKALTDNDFHDVKAGDMGGRVNGMHNLAYDQMTSAWIGEDAQVYDHARVSGQAIVEGESLLDESARVDGFARVNNSTIRGECLVTDHTKVENSTLDTAVRVGGHPSSITNSQLDGEMILTESEVRDIELNLDGARFRHAKIERADDVMLVDTPGKPKATIYPHDRGGFMANSEDYNEETRVDNTLRVQGTTKMEALGDLVDQQMRVEAVHPGMEMAPELNTVKKPEVRLDPPTM